MVIIFLEPFNTNEYKSDYRTILLLGFGGIVFCIHLIQSMLENRWYNKKNKVWLISYEIFSTILFFISSGTIIYLYNRRVINNLNYSLGSYLWYHTHIVVAMIPILTPVIVYLRQTFGEHITPPSPDSYIITGKNKNEHLELQKNTLLYVQAEENYINIYFIDTNNEIQSKTFRQTLSEVHGQISFLQKCHRSYLVNIKNIQEISGNSQNAKIRFSQTEHKIPLSKTYYKDIKNGMV